VREKTHRLNPEAYHGKVCVAFTANEKDRRPVLASATVFEIVRSAFEEAAQRHACTVPIFCLMPDHLHALVIGTTDSSRVLDAMARFKWRSGMKLRPHGIAWQKDFYDHIVRESEGWATQARYAALNPVRAGLITEPELWPYTGSIGYTVAEVLDDAFVIDP
jgi:putative transposase